MKRSTEFGAVVWDMDGMLFDTERLSFVAWRHGASELGLNLDEAIFMGLIGMNSKNIKLSLLESLGQEADVEELTRLAGVKYDELIRQGAPLKPGARECLEALSQMEVPQALATSSSQRIASIKLGFYELLTHFSAFVTGDQVTHSKPHPEPYLTAAHRLGLPPERCLAFEDSVNGIRSAHAAGMYTVLVPDMAIHDEESLGRVHRQFDSLEDALPFLKRTFARD